MRHARTKRRSAATLAVAMVALAETMAIAFSGAAPNTAAASGGGTQQAGAVSVTKTVNRVNVLPDGSNDAAHADVRTVTVSVDRTIDLVDHERINVSWSGAHPSNYTGSPPDVADSMEYPMVLLECRGSDSASASTEQQLTPETCWTQADQRYQTSSSTAFPAWRLDRYAVSGADLPSRFQGITADCPQPAIPTGTGLDKDYGKSTRFVPLAGADGKQHYRLTASCQNLPPEWHSGGSIPDNASFVPTAPDGTGSFRFDVWSDQINSTLGCSASVACSLVAIPVMGISCDESHQGPAAADLAACSYSTTDTSTQTLQRQPYPDGAGDTGFLWWSASNWHNRISIPLSFAKPFVFCPTTGGKNPVSVLGSELMTNAMLQWAPTFCNTSGLFPFVDTPQAEPAAVNLFTAGTGTEATLETYPPEPAAAAEQPYVSAPVAVSGFAIATDIDDVNHHEITGVKLDSRLLAKLLTESYPTMREIACWDTIPGQPAANGGTVPASCAVSRPGASALLGPMYANPLNITQDPEFQALNPGVPVVDQSDGPYWRDDPAAELEALQSESDVMLALTSYIWADPAGRAFLQGTPDPWGMVVNPNYNLSLSANSDLSVPTDQWPLRDTYEISPLPPGHEQCRDYVGFAGLKTPFLPLVAAPKLYLSQISLYNMLYAQPNSTTNCPFVQVPKWTTWPIQSYGHWFMLGVVSLADAKKYSLDTAQLETTTTVQPTQRFSTIDGATFATPTAAGLQAAATQLTADPASGTWTQDYEKLRQKPDAYPGTMLISMTVPTGGIPADDAAAYAALLSYAAGPGQTPGAASGELPGGYLPMTAGNGLGALVDYATRAAAAVAAQACAVPDLTDGTDSYATWESCPAPPTATPTDTPTPTATTSSPAATHSSPRSTTMNSTTTSSSVASGHSTAARTSAVATHHSSSSSARTSGPGTTAPASPSSASVPSAAATPGPATTSAATASTAEPGAFGTAPPSTPAAAGTTPGAGSGLPGLLLPLILGVGLTSGAGAVVLRLKSRPALRTALSGGA